MSILKTSYILFELPPWHANIRKRLVKSSKLYFVDVGLAAWLLGLEKPQQVERDPLRGALFENLCIIEAVKQQLNQGKQPQLYFLRDSNGNEVDLLSTNAGRAFTAIEIKSSQTFQPDFMKVLNFFRKIIDQDIPIEMQVWHRGQQKILFQKAKVLNPLKHGFEL